MSYTFTIRVTTSVDLVISADSLEEANELILAGQTDVDELLRSADYQLETVNFEED